MVQQGLQDYKCTVQTTHCHTVRPNDRVKESLRERREVGGEK